MRRLRDLDTNLFFTYGSWTADPKLAEEIPDLEMAKKLVVKHDIQNADWVSLDKCGRVSFGILIRISN